MTYGRVEVITSVEQRRRWSSAEKQQLVSASLEPGASVSAVARAAGIQPGLLYGWRRQLGVRPRISMVGPHGILRRVEHFLRNSIGILRALRRGDGHRPAPFIGAQDCWRAPRW